MQLASTSTTCAQAPLATYLHEQSCVASIPACRSSHGSSHNSSHLACLARSPVNHLTIATMTVRWAARLHVPHRSRLEHAQKSSHGNNPKLGPLFGLAAQSRMPRHRAAIATRHEQYLFRVAFETIRVISFENFRCQVREWTSVVAPLHTTRLSGAISRKDFQLRKGMPVTVQISLCRTQTADV